MKKRKLGKTDLYLSELGFGCASVWGKSFFGEEEAIALFFKAYGLGINFFDTGFSYNDAEVRLGKCIKQLGSEKRDELVIATKCGTKWCCTIILDTFASRIYKRCEDGGSAMAQKRKYDTEFKIQAVKLGREVGFSKAAKELGINIDTLYGWNKAAKEARLDLGPGTQTPERAMSLTEEVQALRQKNRDLAKENARLKELNEFLEEASAFFAASRRKSPKI